MLTPASPAAFKRNGPRAAPTAGRRGSSTRNRGVTDKSARTKRASCYPQRMQCKLCHREMAPADPIYRPSIGNTTWRGIFGRMVAEVCAQCCATTPSARWPWINYKWRKPEPCKTCGRPVICDTRRKIPKHVVCSNECRRAVYRASDAVRRRYLVRPHPCVVCSRSFIPKRSDARYCSSTCRQKSYRRSLSARGGEIFQPG
jgi:hypothetical protein